MTAYRAPTLVSRNMPRKEEIAAYWNFRCLKCDGFCHEPDHYGFVVDGGSDALDDALPDLVKCARCTGHLAAPEAESWREVHADRCHIIPRWRLLDGSATEITLKEIDSVANVILLCHECHRKDPEHPTRREQLDWMCAERNRLRVANQALLNYYSSEPVDLDDPVLHALVMAACPSGLPDPAEIATRAIEYVREMRKTAGQVPLQGNRGAESPATQLT